MAEAWRRVRGCPTGHGTTAERCISKIKIWRGLAMRSDKKPESYLAGRPLRGALIRIRSLKPAA